MRIHIPQPWYREAEKAWYIQLGGKQRSLGKDKKQAQAKAEKLIREHLRAGGVTTEGVAYSFHELIDRYADWIRTNRAPSNYDVKKYFLGQAEGQGIKTAVDKRLPAAHVKPIQIDAWLREQKGVKSPTTKRLYIGWLIAIYNWGIRFGLVEKNPLVLMDRPAPRVRQDYLPEARFNEFLGALPKPLLDFV